MPLRACRNSWPGYAVRSPGIRKAGTSRKNPLKRIWLKGTGRVQKDLPAKVREKRTGIRSGPAALTGSGEVRRAALLRRPAPRAADGAHDGPVMARLPARKGLTGNLFRSRLRETAPWTFPDLAIMMSGTQAGRNPSGSLSQDRCQRSGVFCGPERLKMISKSVTIQKARMSEKKHFCDILTTGHAALQPRAMADADWIPRTGAGSDPIIKDCVCLNEYPPAVSGKNG